MKYDSYFVWISLILCQYATINCGKGSIYSEQRRSFPALGFKYGLTVDEYNITTGDDYILKLFNIPGTKKTPVLLMHGLIDSADTFILRGNRSLAATLAYAGYDVWVGNTRGNRYGRSHVYLNPDIEKEFWDFSFHDIAEYDLPAIIDFILAKTNSKSLNVIGHSQGNTIFLVLGSILPEYNAKINVLVALSPICFLNHLDNAPLQLMNGASMLDQVLTFIGQEEIWGDDSYMMYLYQSFCTSSAGYAICSNGIFSLAGSDPDELEPDFFKEMVLYYPTGSSRKNAVHTAQIGARKSFTQYDYGSLNIDVYNSTEPPDYDLSQVTMKVALLFGKNDELSTVPDVNLLRDSLPNVVEYREIVHGKFNHIDAVWGRHMYKYLFPQIFYILEKYV